MTKSEFIQKYGIQKYERTKMLQKEWARKKRMGLIQPKSKSKEYGYEYNFSLPVPEGYVQHSETYDAYKKAEFRMQDHIRKKWYRYSKEQYIIVVEWKTTQKNNFLFEGQLYKHNLTDKDKETFKQICEETKVEFKINE